MWVRDGAPHARADERLEDALDAGVGRRGRGGLVAEESLGAVRLELGAVIVVLARLAGGGHGRVHLGLGERGWAVGDRERLVEVCERRERRRDHVGHV